MEENGLNQSILIVMKGEAKHHLFDGAKQVLLKTKPVGGTPYKCYFFSYEDEVFAEAICKEVKIYEKNFVTMTRYMANDKELLALMAKTKWSIEELCEYTLEPNGRQDFYVLCFDEVKFYKNARELTEFCKPCAGMRGNECSGDRCRYFNTFEKKCTKLRSGLEFPTKSWQYIEEVDK